jgi:hypothetical protein
MKEDAVAEDADFLAEMMTDAAKGHGHGIKVPFFYCFPVSAVLF